MLNLKNLSFRPAAIPTIMAFTVSFVFIYLGVWQLERANYKQAEFEVYQLNATLEPTILNEKAVLSFDKSNIQWRNVEITGRYASDVTYLLDNQVEKGDVGYHVYTPINLPNTENWVMVNRGWIAAPLYREQVPKIVTPEGELTIYGEIILPQKSSILGDSRDEDLGRGIWRVQDIKMENFQNRLGGELAPFLIRLGPASASGYSRSWPNPGSGKEMHLAYAFQWFLLAAAVAILYFMSNLKHQQKDNDRKIN
jgi:surfeit locus 1 family protein